MRSEFSCQSGQPGAWPDWGGRQGTAASPAEQSASKEQTGLADTQEEPGGGQSRHQNKEVVHSVGDSETERLDMSSVTSDQDEAAKIAAAAAEMGERSLIHMR